MMDKVKTTNQNKNKDFKKKNIKHNPNAESTRAVFNAPGEKNLD